MLWTCLSLADLPLAVFARGAVSETPAVVASASHRPDVVVANAAATQRGIAAGLSIAAALALDPELTIHLRDERAESQALKSIALWAGQWTSSISIEPPDGVLLEISACCNYFGGLDKLLQGIESGLAAIGFSATMATAPTAGAASLFARAGQAILATEDGDWTRKLATLPLGLLAHARAALDTLSGIGVRSIGEFIALPRDGAARRFGQALLDEVDRARGLLPDPRVPFVPPARYHGQLELPVPVAEVEALLFGVKRLVVELAGFLHGRGAGVTQLRCDLVHEDAAPTSLVLGLSCTRQVEHILNVLRERLARIELPDRVEAIRVVAEEIAPLGAKAVDFFPIAGGDGEAGAQLLERLRARLGEESVRALELRADHRPERAWGQTAMVGAAAASAKTPLGFPLRPLWLLASPRRSEPTRRWRS